MFGLQFFYWAQIQICKIKADAYEQANHQSIPEKQLLLFSSRSTAIHLVNEKEFVAGGKMYDIVKTKIISGVKWYYALGDRAEDADLHGLKDSEKNSAGEKSMPGKTLKVFDAKYFAANVCRDVICRPFSKLLKIGVTSSFVYYASPFRDIFSPPPDRLLS